MLSRVESVKKNVKESGNGKLFNEIDAISKALYVHKNITRTSAPTSSKTHLHNSKSKQKNASDDASSRKDKKSIWDWKPLKALSNVRSRRFNCCFSLQVHAIERLPLVFNDVSMCVNWKRRDGILVTRPVKVSEGIVEFEEKLSTTCSIHGSRNGTHHSAKYEPKHFLLYASVFGSPELDLGKHRIDLSRLLPLTLEELEEEKSTGEWTTSFKLSGKAQGAVMSVSFGYTVIGDNFTSSSGGSKTTSEILKAKQNKTNLVKPAKIVKPSSGAAPQSAEKVKDLHKVLPVSKSQVADSKNAVYHKFNAENFDALALLDHKPELDIFTENLEPVKSLTTNHVSESGKENVCLLEQGFKLLEVEEEQVKVEKLIKKAANVATVETIEVGEIAVICTEGTQLDDHVEENEVPRDKLAIYDFSSEEDDIQCSKQTLMEELESALDIVSNLEAAARDSPEVKLDYKKDGLDDDATECVESEFLNMLGIENCQFGLSSESEPESPRERLLREFEKETLGAGYSLFDFDIDEINPEECTYYDDTYESEWADLLDNVEEDILNETQEMEGKTRAKLLEDLETEELMREWGLNENSFQSSPPETSGGFGSPVDSCPEGLLELPSLGDGLGPFLQTKDGGFLRSMNPSLFNSGKNGGSLVMQVSSPVVVPAEMGSGVMEILQGLASVGIEKLSAQANKLMPLEDITGKTMHQVAFEASATLEGSQSHYMLPHELETSWEDITGGRNRVKGRASIPKINKLDASSNMKETASEFVSLEDLAPLAMDKMEALSLEGLRIQSGLSNEDAPSNISAQSNNGGFLGTEGTAGLQLLDVKDSDDTVDGLMGLSLTLDEWMKLDSGEIDDVDDQISERTSKVLAAHHASSFDVIRKGVKGEKKRGRKCGLLGNNFTVALMVQLRDPLRNYEPVGTPMLAFIQVERVFVAPKPKIYTTVSELSKNEEEEEDDDEHVPLEAALKQEEVAQYRVAEVHVAGLKTEVSGKKKIWGKPNEQQSGSRWLVANGMGKSKKHPLLKSKGGSSLKSETCGDNLWSVSSRKSKDLKRNPNVNFPSDKLFLR